jgi:hypothetical protein
MAIPIQDDFCVYAHINPLRGEIFYIGKGTKGRACFKINRSKHWHSIVNKYGYIIDILEDNLTEEVAFQREVYYIKRIGRSDKGLGPLVNHTDGGEGASGYKHSQETIHRISKARKGTVRSQETKDKISAANKGREGRKQSQGVKSRISTTLKGRVGTMKGKKQSQEAKDKMSKVHKGNTYNLGKTATQETRNKMSAAHNKIVLQIHPTTEKIVNRFSSITEACKYFGLKRNGGQIAGVICGRDKTFKGYNWKYDK